MKICSVIGTRPNFVKEYLINLELRRRGFREVLIHTGQHYDYEMSQAFFECFDLPAPDHHFRLPNNDGLSFSAHAIPELAAVFAAEKPQLRPSLRRCQFYDVRCDCGEQVAHPVCSCRRRDPGGRPVQS